MATFTAKVFEEVKAHRLLSLTNDDGGNATLSITAAGGTPDFYSTKDLKANEFVRVNVTGKAVWRVEAGGELKEGSTVEVGEGGTVVSSGGDGIGFVTNNAKAGQVVELVLSSKGGGAQGPRGPQGPKGDKGAKGDPGEVTKAELDAAINALRDELKGEGA